VSAIADRIAGAPISWGVCEVPGWGVCLDRDRVLGEMAALGLRATELGPPGFLDGEDVDVRGEVAAHGLGLVGGFHVAVLHEPDRFDEEAVRVRRFARTLADAGGTVVVLAAGTGSQGYEERPALTEDGWRSLGEALDRVRDDVGSMGLLATLHPHLGTVVERPDEIERILERSTIPLCLDTGHVFAGGGDPAALARDAAGRVAHVHAKDVDAEVAERLRAGGLGYRDAIAEGLFRPLGHGDAALGEVVGRLEAAGYGGWYVIEQDVVLERTPAPGEGPIRDVEVGLRFLEALDGAPVRG
jgi:inosose dehydratase